MLEKITWLTVFHCPGALILICMKLFIVCANKINSYHDL